MPIALGASFAVLIRCLIIATDCISLYQSTDVNFLTLSKGCAVASAYKDMRLTLLSIFILCVGFEPTAFASECLDLTDSLPIKTQSSPFREEFRLQTTELGEGVVLDNNVAQHFFFRKVFEAAFAKYPGVRSALNYFIRTGFVRLFRINDHPVSEEEFRLMATIYKRSHEDNLAAVFFKKATERLYWADHFWSDRDDYHYLLPREVVSEILHGEYRYHSKAIGWTRRRSKLTPIARLLNDPEIYNHIRTLFFTFEPSVTRESSQYRNTMLALKTVNLGGAKGDSDRHIIADLFFAGTDQRSKIPVFWTADKGIVEGLLVLQFYFRKQRSLIASR